MRPPLALRLFFLALVALGPVQRTGAQSPADWRLARGISATHGHAMVFDHVRERVLLFGGIAAGRFENGTWDWDGASWRELAPRTSPPPRQRHAMASDTARGRVLVFGGIDVAGGLGDTWEWNGIDWTQRHPSAAPSPRHDHAMAADPMRRRIVLFGGALGSTFEYGETWEWDGSQWVQLQPVGSPGARRQHAMAFDPVHGEVLLFGGVGRNDTWSWDGTIWRRRAPATVPPPRSLHAMTTDTARGRVLLVGGSTSSVGSGAVGDAWEWDGADWSQSLSNVPPVSAAGLAYDPLRARTVSFGGRLGGASDNRVTDATWEWNGVLWERRTDERPLGRAWHTMAEDEAAGQVVMFGGSRPNAPYYTDTWLHDGSTWRPWLGPGPSPPERTGAAMAWDAQRRRIVLFGGSTGQVGTRGDTWEWDGRAWSQASASGPPARSGHHLAFDATRGRLLLFGGRTNTFGSALDDLWEWDGVTWARVVTTTGPMARDHALFVADRQRRRVVLFGGRDAASQVLGDTWEWDGSAWQPNLPPMSPAARWLAQGAYDALRQRVVLHGGSDGSPYSLQDTWEWDGSTWSRQRATTWPTSRGAAAMAWHPALQRLLFFGGTPWPESIVPQDTWIYGALEPATTQPFGAGCPGFATTPELVANEPYVGNASQSLDLSSGRAFAPCVFGVSPTASNHPAGNGCTILVADPWLQLRVSSRTGFATLTLPIPLQPSLRGLRVHAQAAVLDWQGPMPSVAMTAGLALHLGD